MIKKLKIENFENHVDSEFEFSDGFNIICGPSNSGKTSIIRALKLVLFNQWTPASLRVGCKNCKITITTNKGTVKVVRGAENSWTVTNSSGEQKSFYKIGKEILPEVTEITGIKPVKLGSFESMPNIMDQLEGHYMLAEMDGESVSGSLRAQIIDEISGLAGMEELIREVNLDNIRNAREIGECETKINDLSSRLHNKTNLKNEETKLNAIEKLFGFVDSNNSGVSDIEVFLKSYNNSLSDYKKHISDLKNFNNLDKLEYEFENLKLLEISYKQVNEFSDSITKYQKALKELKDSDITFDYQNILDLLDKYDELNELYKSCSEAFDNIKKIHLDFSRQNKLMKDYNKQLTEYETMLEKEMKAITVCPLSLKPIKPSCLE